MPIDKSTLALGLAGIAATAAAAAARGGRAPARLGTAAAQGLAGLGQFSLERAMAREAAQAKIAEEQRAEAGQRRVFLFNEEYRASKSREAAARVVPGMHAAALAADSELADIIGEAPPAGLTMEDAKALYDSAQTYVQAKADKLKATDAHDKDVADRTAAAARVKTEDLQARTDAAQEARLREEAVTTARQRKIETGLKVYEALYGKPGAGRTALPVAPGRAASADLALEGKVLANTKNIVDRLQMKVRDAAEDEDETDPVARSLITPGGFGTDPKPNYAPMWPLLDYAAAVEGGDSAEIENAAASAGEATGMDAASFKAAYTEFSRSHPLAADFKSYGSTIATGRRGLAPAGAPAAAAPGFSSEGRRRLLLSLLGDDPELVAALGGAGPAAASPVAPFTQSPAALALQDAERLARGGGYVPVVPFASQPIPTVPRPGAPPPEEFLPDF